MFEVELPNEAPYSMNIDQIRAYIPHRAPFLLVDRVLEIEAKGDMDTLTGPDKVGTRVRALKNVSYNEPHMAGHFPNFSIMPGVLIVEAMAQTTAFSLYPFMKYQGRIGKPFQVALLGVDQARFRKPVVPGDTVIFETVTTKIKGSMWVFDCLAKVDDKRVANASIIANFVA